MRALVASGATVEPARVAALRLFDAIRTAGSEVIARCNVMGQTSETEVLGAGASLQRILNAAEAHQDGTGQLRAQVADDKGIRAAIDEQVTTTGAFVESVGQRIEHLHEMIGAAQQRSARIGGAAKQIDNVARASRILNLNAQIEAARLGDAGQPFMVIGSHLDELSREIESANKIVTDLAATLAEDLPALIAESQALREKAQGFAREFEGQAAHVRTEQDNLMDCIQASLQASEDMSEEVHAAASKAITHMSFQDPLAQNLKQIEKFMRVLVHDAAERIPMFADAEGFSGEAPAAFDLHASGSTSTDEAIPDLVRDPLRPDQGIESNDTDDKAAEAGELLLF